VPMNVLPGWARAVAPVTPTYWAMRGLRSVILRGGGLAEVALPGGVLVAMAGGAAVIALLRFRFQDRKVSLG
jgi:ABC-2 type transport system permease protein